MSRVLIVGAGGVGRVVLRRCAQLGDVFDAICLVSKEGRRSALLASELDRPIRVEILDVWDVDRTVALLQDFRPDILINVATPYENIPLMEACARVGVHYIDTSLLEDDSEEWSYEPQWSFDNRFKEKGITAVLSIGFDPGVVNVYCAYAQKHYFDLIESIEIMDCNAGENGLPFSTNFDPVANIREILARPFWLEGGTWKSAEPLSISRVFDFPGVGPRRAYLMAHEELISLARYIPGVKTLRFWMTFTDRYLTHLRVLQSIGMTSLEPIDYEGVKVKPLYFLKTLLPDPATLGPVTRGITSIMCVIEGYKDGKRRRIRIYNICDHQKAFQETGAQAIAYTAGVPAVLAAQLVLEGVWARPGVHNPEQLDPDPFMERIGASGLPWQIEELPQDMPLEVPLETAAEAKA